MMNTTEATETLATLASVRPVLLTSVLPVSRLGHGYLCLSPWLPASVSLTQSVRLYPAASMAGRLRCTDLPPPPPAKPAATLVELRVCQADRNFTVSCG